MSKGRGDGGRQLFSCEIEGVSTELQATDLSHAGLFVPTRAKLRSDAELDVRLVSPIGEAVLRGQIVQVISAERAKAETRRAGYGLLFMDLEDDQRAWISLTLDALARAAPKPAPAVTKKPSKRPPEPQAPAPKLPVTSTLRELEQRLASLQNKPPWEVLGIEPTAGPDAAHEAFLQQSKRFHPHAFARFDSPEVSQAATELFIAHKRAYAALSKGSLRPLGAAPTVQAPKTPSVIKPAKTPSVLQAPKAPSGIQASKTPSVLQAPKAPSGIQASKTPSVLRGPKAPSGVQPPRAPPASLPPAKGQIAAAQLLVQTGLKHLAASRFDAAAEELERAVTLCPDYHDAALWLQICLARKLKTIGKSEDALAAYQAVLAIDPDHREAREYLEAQAPRRGGVIGKWFGSEGT